MRRIFIGFGFHQVSNAADIYADVDTAIARYEQGKFDRAGFHFGDTVKLILIGSEGKNKNTLPATEIAKAISNTAAAENDLYV